MMERPNGWLATCLLSFISFVSQTAGPLLHHVNNSWAAFIQLELSYIINGHEQHTKMQE